MQRQLLSSKPPEAPASPSSSSRPPTKDAAGKARAADSGCGLGCMLDDRSLCVLREWRGCDGAHGPGSGCGCVCQRWIWNGQIWPRRGDHTQWLSPHLTGGAALGLARDAGGTDCDAFDRRYLVEGVVDAVLVGKRCMENKKNPTHTQDLSMEMHGNEGGECVYVPS